jgi:hypothetical protein
MFFAFCAVRPAFVRLIPNRRALQALLSPRRRIQFLLPSPPGRRALAGTAARIGYHSSLRLRPSLVKRRRAPRRLRDNSHDDADRRCFAFPGLRIAVSHLPLTTCNLLFAVCGLLSAVLRSALQLRTWDLGLHLRDFGPAPSLVTRHSSLLFRTARERFRSVPVFSSGARGGPV